MSSIDCMVEVSQVWEGISYRAWFKPLLVFLNAARRIQHVGFGIVLLADRFPNLLTPLHIVDLSPIPSIVHCRSHTICTISFLNRAHTHDLVDIIQMVLTVAIWIRCS